MRVREEVKGEKEKTGAVPCPEASSGGDTPTAYIQMSNVLALQLITR